MEFENAKKTTTAARLIEIMEEENLKQIDILNKCAPFCKKYNKEISKALLSAWIHDKAQPKQDRLHILALALNVSEAWLMGYDVIKDRASTPIGAAKNALDKLTPDQRKKLFAYYEALNNLTEDKE